MNNPIVKKFSFDSYTVSDDYQRIDFQYTISFENKDPLVFVEGLEFHEKIPQTNIPTEILERFCEAVHLMLGISYYKLYCPKNIEHPYELTKEQADYWDTLYRKGLGEFYYQNKINPKKQAPTFDIKQAEESPHDIEHTFSDRSLVGVGGGKDSIVSAELLREGGFDFDAYVVEIQKEYPLINDVIEVMDVGVVKARRILDEKIFQKHDGAYNGHIPITGIYSWVGLLTAALYDYRYLVISNGQTANEGNLEYKGDIINHQWSKSEEHEDLLQNYVYKFITKDLTCFSVIRPFYELRVIKEFARFPKYFKTFSSCNKNFLIKEKRDTQWCGECSKCKYMFLALAAFLEKDTLLEIFGKNLFEDENSLEEYKNLLGIGEAKPFDCVGTFDESMAAFFLGEEKYKDSYIYKELLPAFENHDKKKVIDHVLRPVQTNIVPTQFQLLGMHSCVIVGYGKEGRMTEKFLQKKYPHIKIGIADMMNDPDYLSRQFEYDFAIKTPGIQKEKISIPYTTATNLFFSHIHQTNKIIGVTGTKGKSTTSSLIAHIFEKAGIKSRLLGNIGKPMLEVLLEENRDPNEIFILELSSYQLDDINFSPHVAVITNLLQDHISYHGLLAIYHNAKRRIIDFQRPSNTFIYNHEDGKSVQWSQEHNAHVIPFSKDILIKAEQTMLLGEHNQRNIQAAITVCDLFDIDKDIIVEAIKTFKPLEHRLEFVGTYHGIQFYNDALSTTPDSTIAAIYALDHVDTIFLGGEDRGYDFSKLNFVLHDSKVRNVVLFPDSGKRILFHAEKFNILETDSMEEAVKFAYKHTKQGMICLLSTASPSFSVWKDYVEKGTLFKDYVKKHGGAEDEY